MTEGKPDTTEKVEQTETGYVLNVTSTRGTGTRDQDKVKAKAKTETLEELEAERARVQNLVTATMSNLREFDPDGEAE